MTTCTRDCVTFMQIYSKYFSRVAHSKASEYSTTSFKLCYENNRSMRWLFCKRLIEVFSHRRMTQFRRWIRRQRRVKINLTIKVRKERKRARGDDIFIFIFFFCRRQSNFRGILKKHREPTISERKSFSFPCVFVSQIITKESHHGFCVAGELRLVAHELMQESCAIKQFH